MSSSHSSITPNIAAVIAGNSGAGKSFLANILAGRETFVHRISADSVTTGVEYLDVTANFLDEQVCMRLFNIPGLLEITATKIQRNKNAFAAAMKVCARQLLIFVMGNTNGRPRAEDIVAFQAVQKSYEVKPDSVLFVFMSKPTERISETYEDEVLGLVKEALQWKADTPFFHVFVEQFSSNVMKAKGADGKLDLQQPCFQEARGHLWDAIHLVCPGARAHTLVAEMELTADDRVKKYQQMMESLTNEMAQNKQRHEEFLANTQQEMAELRNQLAEAQKQRQKNPRGFTLAFGKFSVSVSF